MCWSAVGWGVVAVLGGVRGLGVGGGINCHVMSIVHMSGFFKGVRRIGVELGGFAAVVMLSRF